MENDVLFDGLKIDMHSISIFTDWLAWPFKFFLSNAAQSSKRYIMPTTSSKNMMPPDCVFQVERGEVKGCNLDMNRSTYMTRELIISHDKEKDRYPLTSLEESSL